jgi:hypothetical protein
MAEEAHGQVCSSSTSEEGKQKKHQFRNTPDDTWRKQFVYHENKESQHICSQERYAENCHKPNKYFRTFFSS